MLCEPCNRRILHLDHIDPFARVVDLHGPEPAFPVTRPEILVNEAAEIDEFAGLDAVCIPKQLAHFLRIDAGALDLAILPLR